MHENTDRDGGWGRYVRPRIGWRGRGAQARETQRINLQGESVAAEPERLLGARPATRKPTRGQVEGRASASSTAAEGAAARLRDASAAKQGTTGATTGFTQDPNPGATGARTGATEGPNPEATGARTRSTEGPIPGATGFRTGATEGPNPATEGRYRATSHWGQCSGAEATARS